jgi:hypothetical protein
MQNQNWGQALDRNDLRSLNGNWLRGDIELHMLRVGDVGECILDGVDVVGLPVGRTVSMTI